MAKLKGPTINKEIGFPCGTIPSKRKLKVPVRGTDSLPNWTVDESFEFFKKRAYWEREDLYPISKFQKNQGSRGSCNYYAMVMLIERAIMRQYGYHIKLSPELGYANNVNGNDMGSTLPESMRDIVKVGAPPFLQRHYQKIKRRDFTPEDYKNALRFTGIETIRILDWEMLVAAVAVGYPCLIAVGAGGRQFLDMDSDGFAGFVPGNPGDHAIIVDRPKEGRRKRGLENPGSWGTNVHDNGIAGITEQHFNATIRHHPAWALKSIRLDPEVKIDFKLSLSL